MHRISGTVPRPCKIFWSGGVVRKMENTRFVNKGIVKKDAKALLSGRPVYTDDIAPSDCLVVKLLRSPHAHAWIEDISTAAALKVPGIEAVFTYKDVPEKRYTQAGQTFPEPSPDDRLILDQHIRYNGDPVAIIAGKDENCVSQAMKRIKVKYKVLEPLLDFTKAIDNPIIIHPEDNYVVKSDIGNDVKRNICASQCRGNGDIDKVLSECDYTIDQTYHIKAVSQAMMEVFCAFTSIDIYGRIKVISSTQIPFHARRIIARGLNIPKSKVRVVKPRIGGGFGAKQTAVMEIYPAFVTYKTGKPAKLVFTREECFIQGSPRHEMQVHVRLGADKNGKIRGIDLSTLSNTGAFGEHGPTTVDLSGTKSLSLYRMEAFRFKTEVVYTNVLSAGAYRGYGATQGIFAVESAVNELAHKLDIDPIKLREMNMVREGDLLTNYFGEVTNSCNLDKCVAKVKEMIGWDEKYPYVKTGPHTVRSVGMAMAMQGSGIGGVDVGSVQLKLNDDGFYTLMIGCSDMGTGCDTILAQMTADGLGCEFDDIIVRGVDTDQSPYDSGSYASSTTYVTGKAVLKACEGLKENLCKLAAEILQCEYDELVFTGKSVKNLKTNEEVLLFDLATKSMCGNEIPVQVTMSHSSPVSPPPFMVGMVEIELDKYTGQVDVLDYVAVVDCGTVINTNLARVQTEGGIVQGIGMALYENIQYSAKGAINENSFMQYKIPTRLDMGRLRVEFESSYEQSGPFGAKSIGEIVINTPSPAIAHAIFNATGIWLRDLPMTPEKVLMSLPEE